MMCSTTVRKSPSVVVRPWLEPTTMTTTTETIKLSPLDKANYPLSVLLLYQSPVNNAANTIRRALSEALVHYYPFCGRVVVSGADGGGDGSIQCTGGRDEEEEQQGGGVEFIAASAHCSLQASKLLERLPPRGGSSTTTTTTSSPSLLDELAVYYPMGSEPTYGPGDPLLSVQVTEFSCGGFVLGVTWNHLVADGIGVAQFLGAVGELARGLPSAPSVVPVRWDEAVSSSRPPPPMTDVGRDAVALSMMLKGAAVLEAPLPLVSLDVTIPSSFIHRVKAEFPASTTFEVVLAVLWQCRTRAIMSTSSSRPGRADDGDDDALSVVAFPVNVRKHVGAKDGYYGNCAIDKLVMATSSTVASADLVDLVNMIKHAKDQVAADMMQLNNKNNVPEENKDEDESKSSRRSQLLRRLQGSSSTLLEDDWRYSMFTVSSWRNIGFEKVDFGSGQPARVMWHGTGVPPLPFCVAFKGRDGGDGGANVLSFCVKEEHAEAFLAEIAKLISS